jgi:hypothetical protein
LHSYLVEFHRELDSYQDELSAHPELIARLDPEQADKVLSYLVELACQSQNMLNTTQARDALSAIPKDWLRTHINRIAEAQLDLEDEWEYRRLGEIYLRLAPELVHAQIERGKASKQPDIQMAAQDLAALLAKGHTP